MVYNIDTMLQEGIIEPYSRNWSNSTVMIMKRSRKYKFCSDFRKVNKFTKKDLYSVLILSKI